MRIAQVAPLYESVPPKTYGGTERVVHYLTESLVSFGHDVTLFAAADSNTSARLRPVVPESLRLSRTVRDPIACHMMELAKVDREVDKFDIVHFHIDFFQYPLCRHWRTPSLTTLHGRLDLPDLGPAFREFREAPVVSISDNQRTPLPEASWVGTVYHGLPTDLYTFQAAPQDYVVFLGRISPEKGPEAAIEIAKRAGIKLKIAAKVDSADREYFESRVRPLLEHPLIEWVGEVDERGKNQLLGGAQALLFPIDWPEPFGLVMIEAMACGTPVVAFRRGSVPEVMDDGVSGFVVDSIDEAVEVLSRLNSFDRLQCRQYFESRFTSDVMAKNYLAIYQRLIDQRTRRGMGPKHMEWQLRNAISSPAWAAGDQGAVAKLQ